MERETSLSLFRITIEIYRVFISSRHYMTQHTYANKKCQQMADM